VRNMPISRTDVPSSQYKYGEYRTKRMILEIYDEMLRAMERGETYRTRLDPLPADLSMAHPPKSEAMLEGQR